MNLTLFSSPHSPVSPPSDETCQDRSDLSHYITEPDFKYMDFAKRGEISTIPTFRAQVCRTSALQVFPLQPRHASGTLYLLDHVFIPQNSNLFSKTYLMSQVFHGLILLCLFVVVVGFFLLCYFMHTLGYTKWEDWSLIEVKFASGIKNINCWFLPIYTDVCSTVYSVLSRVLWKILVGQCLEHTCVSSQEDHSENFRTTVQLQVCHLSGLKMCRCGFLQDYTWEDQGFSLLNRYYPDIAPMLDDKFRLAYNLTYNT